jgi:aspartyl-tRNA(Asn)/glutamyl-tRNA(Gln) amidotransferase subunit C
MNREDILHLGELSRVALTDQEVSALETELSAIVSYVSTVTDIIGDESETAPQVGARYNVLRADVITNTPDQYTEAILKEMPKTRGRQLQVKKILKTN